MPDQSWLNIFVETVLLLYYSVPQDASQTVQHSQNASPHIAFILHESCHTDSGKLLNIEYVQRHHYSVLCEIQSLRAAHCSHYTVPTFPVCQHGEGKP